MKKILAVAGFGGQGQWHADYINNSDVVSLAGVFDADPEKMALAEEKNIHTYSSYKQLLEDPKVEGVVITTPNKFHRDMVIDALNAKKHVICEKPVELSLENFDLMVKAAKENDRVFTVHQNRRFDVDFLSIKSIVEEKKLGNVINIESRVHGSRGVPNDWRSKREFGGGMMYDWGVHLIDQMLCLIDEKIISVACFCTHITSKEVDDGFKLFLTFESGKSGYIEVGTFNFLAMPRFYLQADGGTALLEDWKSKAKCALCTSFSEENVLPVQTAAGITKTMAPRNEKTLDVFEIERVESDVHDFYRNFVKAMDKKEEPMVTLSQIRRVMQVMEAAFLSDKEGITVKTNI